MPSSKEQEGTSSHGAQTSSLPEPQPNSVTVVQLDASDDELEETGAEKPVIDIIVID